jgi:hypothetical protein
VCTRAGLDVVRREPHVPLEYIYNRRQKYLGTQKYLVAQGYWLVVLEYVSRDITKVLARTDRR